MNPGLVFTDRNMEIFENSNDELSINQTEDNRSGFEEENDDDRSDDDKSELYNDDSSGDEDDKGLEFNEELYSKHHLNDSEIINGERVNS